MLVPGLAARIALAGASHGALLDQSYSGHAGVMAAFTRESRSESGVAGRVRSCRRARSPGAFALCA
jgi:hypothetical protein